MTDERITIGAYWLGRVANAPGHYAFWYDRDRRQTRRYSLGVADLLEAMTILQEWQRRGLAGDPKLHKREPRLRTVGDLLAWDLAHYGETIPSADVQKAATLWLTMVIGNVTIVGFDDEVVKRARDELLELGLALSTIGRYLTCLRAGSNRAFRKKLIAAPLDVANVEDQAHRDAQADRGRAMSVREIARFVGAFNDPHMVVMIVYLLNTLSRPDAIRELEPRQVNHDHGFVALNREGRRQTKKYRATVPLTDTLRPWTIGLPEGPVVLYRNRPVGSTKTAVRAARERASLDDKVSLYSLRRSGSIALRRAGVPPEEIAVMMGHRPVNSKRVTEVYSPWEPEYLMKAKLALESWVREIAALCTKHDLLKPFWTPSGGAT